MHDSLFAYVAHPIDLAGESSWLGSMLADLDNLLFGAGIGAFKPGKAYLTNNSDQHHAAKIDALNNRAIDQADCLVAVLPADIATLGTPVEISYALNLRKPVVVFTDIVFSVQLAAWQRRGAVIVGMADPEFVWPTPADLVDLIAHSKRKVAEFGWKPDTYPHAGVPFVKSGPPEIELFKPPPFLVSGAAANASRGRYAGDAGIDLAISQPVILEPGEYRMVPTGVYGAIPEGYFGLLTGRSSTWSRHRCDVRQSIIDHGYRGELMLGIENRSGYVIEFSAGTRLGQIVLLPVFNGGLVVVDELPEAERGHNGYGSSDDPPTEQIEPITEVLG